MTSFYSFFSPVASLDLKTVRNALWDARCQWYDIGIELDLKQSTLNAIETDYQGKVEHCFTEVLSEWLNCAVPQPSWGALVEALESKTVNHCNLAAEIRREYMKQE